MLCVESTLHAIHSAEASQAGGSCLKCAHAATKASWACTETAHSAHTHAWHRTSSGHNGKRRSPHPAHRITHSWEHEVHVQVKWSVSLFLGLDLLLLLDVVSALLDFLNTSREISDKLNEVGHHELLKSASPANFHSDVGLNKLVTSVKHRSDHFFVLHRHDEAEQIFSQCWVTALSNRFHGVLSKAVPL